MQTVQPRPAVHPPGEDQLAGPRSARVRDGLDQEWPLGLRLLVWLVTCLAVAAGAAVHPLVGAGVALAVVLGLVLLDRPVLAALLAVSVAPAVSGLARGLVIPGVCLSELLIIAAAAALKATGTLGGCSRSRGSTWMVRGAGLGVFMP